jgi:homoserine O-succinyltransferase
MVLLTSRGADEGEPRPPTIRGSGLLEDEGSIIAGRLRIGIINIMPHAETYEPNILRPLSSSRLPVAPVWIRLRSHAYGSSEAAHIQSRYVYFEDAIHREPLDGLILSGAPVEALAFEDVHYWPELVEILAYCRSRVTSALGLCWGGLAMAKQLGIEKHSFEKKLFGVFENRSLVPDHVFTEGSDDLFRCAHSRHSGIGDAELERARDAGIVRLLSHGPETGYAIFESADHRYLMHLGHPEYDATRLVFEWERDSALGRRDVEAPRHFDARHPANVWRSHCDTLFRQWLRYLGVSARSQAEPGP